MKYARLEPISGQISAYIDITQEQYDALDGNPKQAYLRAFVTDPRPVPSATQIVIDGPVVLGATTATQTWVLQDKTAEQLADDAAATQEVADLAQLRLVYAALVAGAGTAAERLARIERSVAYLLRKYGADRSGGPVL